MGSDSYLHYIKIICYFYVQLTINQHCTDFQAPVSGTSISFPDRPTHSCIKFLFQEQVEDQGLRLAGTNHFRPNHTLQVHTVYDIIIIHKQ